MDTLSASTYAKPRRLTSMFELFDSCQQAVIEIDSDSSVIRYNRTAETLFALRIGLSISYRNRLRAARPPETKWLRNLISSACDNGCPSKRPLVTVPINQQNLMMSLVPFCINCREMLGGNCDYHVVLLPVRSQENVTVPEAIIGDTYSLTIAETRVAKQILMGNSPSEIASINNVSINTVRSQLRSIYKKTNTKGQYDLAGRILIDCISPMILWRGNSPIPGTMLQGI